ncbi:MAG: hypothetical protein R2860_01830 [Desulfobacterales bacterium]
MLYEAVDAETEAAAARKQPYLVKSRRWTGEYLTDARVQIDSQFNEPYVAIDFDRKGAKLFERVTGENVKSGWPLSWTRSIPRPPSRKNSGGSARITGVSLRRLTTWPLC